MDLAKKAVFFRQTDCRKGLFLLLGLLAGCSHATRQAPPVTAPRPSQTVNIGVPACNAYLNRYLACHQVLHSFSGDSLQSHYQAMLASLQQSAADPQVRPYLANRCLGMSQQLDDALQGRPCTAPAASAATPSSTPMRTQH
jgi:hypothetical protein